MTRTPHQALLNLPQRFGTVSTLGAGRMRYVFLLGPQANDFVLSNSELFSWGKSFEALMVVNGGTALLLSDGEQHRRRRQVLVPKFAHGEVTGYTDQMRAAADSVIDEWRPGQRLDMSVEIRKMVRRGTIATLFGPRLTADEAWLGALIDRALVVVDRPQPVQSLQRLGMPSWRRAVSARREVAERVVAEVAHRRGCPEEAGDVLSLLLARSDLTETEIIDQVISVTAASYVTSSAAMSWVANALLADREVWRRSADSVPGSGWRYLDGVVSESLRMHPPVALLPRVVVKPFTYQGLRIPPGNRVLISPYVTHRTAELWPDPHRFDPHRWDPEGPAYRKPGRHEYLPFGGGPHRCLGAGFAVAELTVIVEQLLRRTTLTLDAVDARPVGLADMRPRSGPHATVTALA
ncbi:hypothetical protein BU204_17065 [Actinophytocola xanthii]|uniref:Cytochrome P450 n=1 Tax=Actinophytocola xanthii TaxID=1912961 RepID=A0A1Q8CPW0_9PSEU|nr:hypothetical protein BU204_17065 [Actinophytocola xanthii]